MSRQEEVAERFGPHGRGTSGFKVPGDGTLDKGQPADEQSPKATGIESQGGQDAATLGVLTQDDREGYGGGGLRQEFVAGAEPDQGAMLEARTSHAGDAGMRPESARAKDLSPDAELQPRIPETKRDDESPAGLGKGVGPPPGSVGRETGATP
jgi:hypothetical protein